MERTTETKVPAYAHLLGDAQKLSRKDRISLVQALAGQLGMIAQFPSSAIAAKGPESSRPSGNSPRKEKKKPAKQEPSNPLAGTSIKKSFDSAKAEVAGMKKKGVDKSAPEVFKSAIAVLEERKSEYFRTLSSAKGPKTSETGESQSPA